MNDTGDVRPTRWQSTRSPSSRIRRRRCDHGSAAEWTTIFGEGVAGMGVADKIGLTPVEGDRATRRVAIKVELP